MGVKSIRVQYYGPSGSEVKLHRLHANLNRCCAKHWGILPLILRLTDCRTDNAQTRNINFVFYLARKTSDQILVFACNIISTFIPISLSLF
jgi:hypothetical protein